jgi:hypothetical protein
VNLSAARRLRDLIQREDIDILHSHGYKTDLIGLLATRGMRCKIISTPHGWSKQADFKLISVRIEKVHLRSGLFSIGFWIANRPNVFDYIELGGTIEVIERATREFGHTTDGLVTCSFSVIELTNRVQDPCLPVAGKEPSHPSVLPSK